MSILGRNTDCVPCEPSNYVDNSLYLDDARILLSAVNVEKVRQVVAEQLHLAYKIAQDHNSTSEEFYEQVQKLQAAAKIYMQVDRLKNQSK